MADGILVRVANTGDTGDILVFGKLCDLFKELVLVLLEFLEFDLMCGAYGLKGGTCALQFGLRGFERGGGSVKGAGRGTSIMKRVTAQA